MKQTKKNKICYNCEVSSDTKKSSVKKKLAPWKVEMGLKTHFPNDIIMPLKVNIPKKYDSNYELKLGKKNANKYVYYYCANKKETSDCLTSFSSKDVYGDGFSNRGVVKCDNEGIANIKFMCPQAYYVNDKDTLHLPHLHYFISDKENKKWNEKLYTERIICDLNKKQLTDIINNQCALVFNALPFHEYMKGRIPKSLPVPYDIMTNDKVTKSQFMEYVRDMLVHYPKINKKVVDKKLKIENIPIVVYCYNDKCEASSILIEKLIEMGFIDIKEYSEGITGWEK